VRIAFRGFVQKARGGSFFCSLRSDLPLLFFEECSKLITPAEVARMNLLKHRELLACRGRIAPKLCQEVNNASLLGDLLFRDIHLSNSLNEIVHNGLTIHHPTCPLDSREMVVEPYGRTA
jgi:hypothetical protein